MQSIKTPGAGERLSAATIKQIVEALKAQSKIVGGPGIVVTNNAAGVTISLVQRPNTGVSKPEVSGEAKPLNTTQGELDTDTYDRAADKVPVKFKVVTDIQYDTTTHKLNMAYREIVATGIVSISEEPEWVEITEAQPYP